jgi:hypothetical protein
MIKGVSLTHILLFAIALFLLMNWQEQRNIDRTLKDVDRTVFSVREAICSLAGTNCNGLNSDEE